MESVSVMPQWLQTKALVIMNFEVGYLTAVKASLSVAVSLASFFLTEEYVAPVRADLSLVVPFWGILHRVTYEIVRVSLVNVLP